MSTTRKIKFSFLAVAALFLIVSFTLVNCSSSGGGNTSAKVFHLPKTGQITSYETSTVPRDDGSLQMGAAWPDPRFTVNSRPSGTTVTDKMTGLIWSCNANIMTTRDPLFDTDGGGTNDGDVTWEHANAYIAKLNAENYLGYSDWRLPNIRELRSLVNHRVTDISSWLLSQGFSNVMSYGYWSSTTDQSAPANAWYVWMWNGHVFSAAKTFSNTNVAMVWPVRNESTTAVNVMRTGQTICSDTTGTVIACSGTGQDGDSQSGVAWPATRFTMNSGLTGTTITDNLTGLLWVSDGSTPADGACTGGYLQWQAAFTYVDCLNGLNYSGYNDWRLPNIIELESLVNYGEGNVAAWLEGQGFSNMAATYWSSTTRIEAIARVRIVDMTIGQVIDDDKSMSHRVMPVRGGN